MTPSTSPSNEELVQQLRQRIRARMDGVMATSMRTKGIDYSYNFGLSIPQIRTLAMDVPHTQSLAEELLSAKLRELRLLGLIIYPPTTLSLERAISIAEGLATQEQKDLYTYHLLSSIEEEETIYLQFWSVASLRSLLLSALTRRVILKKSTSPIVLETIVRELLHIDREESPFTQVEVSFLERVVSLTPFRAIVCERIKDWEHSSQPDLVEVAAFLSDVIEERELKEQQ